MTVWYVQYAKKTLGPFDDMALKELAINGKINQETLIRNGEKGNWTKSGKLKGLFDIAVPHNALDIALDKIANDKVKNSVSTPVISSIPPALQIPAVPKSGDESTVFVPDFIPYMPIQKPTVASSSSKLKPGPQRNEPRYQLLIVGAISSAISLGVGYLAGVEHVKFSIRTKFEQFGKAFQQSMREGLGSSNDFNQMNKTNEIVTKGSDLEASRREWISISYGSTIAYKDARTWTDTDAKTGKLLFIMNYVGHTSEYVELFNSVRNDQLRLYPDHMEAKLEKGWQSIGSGHWKK